MDRFNSSYTNEKKNNEVKAVVMAVDWHETTVFRCKDHGDELISLGVKLHKKVSYRYLPEHGEPCPACEEEVFND